MDVQQWPAEVVRSLKGKTAVLARGGMGRSHEISYIHSSATEANTRVVTGFNHLPSSELQHTVQRLLKTSPAWLKGTSMVWV